MSTCFRFLTNNSRADIFTQRHKRCHSLHYQCILNVLNIYESLREVGDYIQRLEVCCPRTKDFCLEKSEYIFYWFYLGGDLIFTNRTDFQQFAYYCPACNGKISLRRHPKTDGSQNLWHFKVLLDRKASHSVISTGDSVQLSWQIANTVSECANCKDTSFKIASTTSKSEIQILICEIAMNDFRT